MVEILMGDLPGGALEGRRGGAKVAHDGGLLTGGAKEKRHRAAEALGVVL